MARPTDYSSEIASLICERLADGESLRAICRDEAMPGRTTVWQWMDRFPEFANQYARAREAQADAMADDIVAIADNAEEDANSRRVRVDARKWVAAKLRPGTYGDKIEATHKGAITVNIDGRWT